MFSTVVNVAANAANANYQMYQVGGLLPNLNHMLSHHVKELLARIAPLGGSTGMMMLMAMMVMVVVIAGGPRGGRGRETRCASCGVEMQSATVEVSGARGGHVWR